MSLGEDAALVMCGGVGAPMSTLSMLCLPLHLQGGETSSGSVLIVTIALAVKAR
jgi:hypothetical protein